MFRRSALGCTFGIARQHRADLRGLPPTAAGRPHAASVQHQGDPAQAGDAAGPDLPDDGRNVAAKRHAPAAVRAALASAGVTAPILTSPDTAVRKLMRVLAAAAAPAA